MKAQQEEHVLKATNPEAVERVVDVFEEFQNHPAVKSGFYVAHRALIAAQLTAAYFASQPSTTIINRAVKKTGKR